MSENKLCPFCGSENVKPEWMMHGNVSTICYECEAEGPPRSTEAEALEAWNMRAPAPRSQRAPLTYRQINSILYSVPDDDDDAEWMLTDAQLLKIIRAAEAAHGITQEKQG